MALSNRPLNSKGAAKADSGAGRTLRDHVLSVGSEFLQILKSAQPGHEKVTKDNKVCTRCADEKFIESQSLHESVAHFLVSHAEFKEFEWKQGQESKQRAMA